LPIGIDEDAAMPVIERRQGQLGPDGEPGEGLPDSLETWRLAA